mgnify:FL=1
MGIAESGLRWETTRPAGPPVPGAPAARSRNHDTDCLRTARGALLNRTRLLTRRPPPLGCGGITPRLAGRGTVFTSWISKKRKKSDQNDHFWSFWSIKIVKIVHFGRFGWSKSRFEWVKTPFLVVNRRKSDIFFTFFQKNWKIFDFFHFFLLFFVSKRKKNA